MVAGAVLLAANYGMVANNLPLTDTVFDAPLGFDVGGAAGVEHSPPGGPNVVIEDPEHRYITELPGRVREEALRQLLTQSVITLGVMAVASVGLGWLRGCRRGPIGS